MATMAEAPLTAVLLQQRAPFKYHGTFVTQAALDAQHCTAASAAATSSWPP